MGQEDLINKLLGNFAKQAETGEPYSVVKIHKSQDGTITTTETPIIGTKKGRQRLAHEKSKTISEEPKE